MRASKVILSALIFSTGSAHAEDFFRLEGQKNPERRMQIRQSGVPAFPLYSKETVSKEGDDQTVFSKSSEIPRLDIGKEGELKHESLDALNPPERPRALRQGISVKTGKVPSFTIPEIKIAEVQPKNQKQRKIASTPKAVPRLEDHKPKIEDKFLKNVAKAKELENFSPSRLKLLQGLIFLQEIEEYPLALGLFAELTKDKEVGQEAEYYLGLTAKKVGLHAEFRRRMLGILPNKKSPMRTAALEQLMAHIPANNFQLAHQILPHARQILEKEVDHPRFSLVEAKIELEKNNLDEATKWLAKIQDKTPEEHDRRYLQGVIAYRTGKGDEAREHLTRLLSDLKNKPERKDLRSLGALTLARLYFQIGEYQKAYDSYLIVDKQHALWVDSLIEQAWSQILAQDYEGAAGNMFSLHTELFKGIFKPESHIARTVSYVNLCQYGDALHVLKDFKETYTPAHASLMSFQKKNKGKDAYYDLVREFLSAQGDAKKEIQGIGSPFLFEFARHPQFIGLQGEINALAKEGETFNVVYSQLIEIERKAIEETSTIQQATHELRKKYIGETNERRKKNLEDRIEKQERSVLSYEIQRYIANKSRTAIKELRQEGLKVLAEESEYYRVRAADFLQHRFAQLSGNLKYFLEQADLLQYEIFSGAGEHLRFQMAGGEVSDTKAKEVKVADKEAQNWKYQGELWSDEVGFFRSSLKNVCPPEEVAKR